MSGPPVIRRRREEVTAPTGPRADVEASVARLGAIGQIYVTAAAAATYAADLRLQPEEARRELTTILLDARVSSDDGSAMSVRARSRTTQVDVSARVVREGRLLVVVSAHAREYR